MHERWPGTRRALKLAAEHYRDVDLAIRHYFSPGCKQFERTFAGDRPSDVDNRRQNRLREAEYTAILTILTIIEASFQRDCDLRVKGAYDDVISKRLRDCGSEALRLHEILDIWMQNAEDRADLTARAELIEEYRRLLPVRHWLAHGRYWSVESEPDFENTYQLALNIFNRFNFKQ